MRRTGGEVRPGQGRAARMSAFVGGVPTSGDTDRLGRKGCCPCGLWAGLWAGSGPGGGHVAIGYSRTHAGWAGLLEGPSTPRERKIVKVGLPERA